MKQKSYYKQYGNTVVYFLWDKKFQQYFKGISVCQPEDTFNLETGIKIAKQKALVKMHSYYARIIEERIDVLETLKSIETEMREKYEYWKNLAEKDFNRLTDLLEQQNKQHEEE